MFSSLKIRILKIFRWELSLLFLENIHQLGYNSSFRELREDEIKYIGDAENEPLINNGPTEEVIDDNRSDSEN